MRLAVGLALIVSMTGRDARAQWGFDGWGWWGWGVGTPESLELQAAGHFAMGAGIYNLKTAQANSIDASTAMKFNDYVAEVTRESARLHAARVDQRLARNRSLYDARQKQLRENPSRRDIEIGDALNAAVADLSDPRLGRSALRAATAPLPASLIAGVPFLNAAERVTLMLENLRASVKWSDVFEGERFAADKKTFEDLIGQMREQAYEGDVSPRLLREARRFVSELRAKVEAQPLPDPGDQKEALRFTTACTSLLDLLEKPNIGPALLELRRIQDTRVGNLLGFMHAFNLRFGPATSPTERENYHRLFAILDQTRDQILAEARLEATAPPPTNPTNATEFFQDLDKGRSPTGASPQPPKSRNPR
jgi:hypothetical protein